MKIAGYGNSKQPYVLLTEGNKLPRRTNFAGYVANKFSKEVAIN